MLEEFAAQFNSGWAAVAAVVGVLCLVPTKAIQLLHLYDSHLARRQYKLLKELRAAESSESLYAQYLDDSLYLESFRIASGVRADRAKAEFLMRLARTGRWNHWQIRQIARYLWVTPEQPRLTLRITAVETAGAWSARLVGFFLMAIGCICGLIIMAKASSFAAFSGGMGAQAMFILGGALISSPFNSYCTARRFQKYVETHPELLDEVATIPSTVSTKGSTHDAESAAAV
ncbi:hypothetical protein N5C70_25585 [Pseudomonas juntendi]|uniref:Uncharacterized protein n=1 Tax=Pseudomonas juntendi TaxID=2666183 RepID=A0ABD4YKG0_9PSED|nr:MULTISPECIES: hypothetical protein [Pseudomonas]MDH0760037.1 hypothetical protein [Pseudomonas juntendi]MDH1918793.1 hypothetical protein [Pseudomonas juntendi]RRV76420.1 hypothetical protein EGJ15_03655 [Pseudomonas sp. p99-361]